MAKIAELQEIAVSLIRPYEKNAKIHSDEQIAAIMRSIEEFGFLTPCLVERETYNLIAGHGRVEAAKRLGMETVPCVFVEDISDVQRRAYILADNRLTELGGWDDQLVSDELQNLRDAGFDFQITGFDLDDIIIEEDAGCDIEEDELAEMEQAEPRIRPGEIWQLGRHRLMCGDSTKTSDVFQLVGGASIDLLLTDPPYNVALGQTTGHPLRPSEAKQLHRRTDGLVIENDAMEDKAFEEFLVAALGAAYDVMKPGAAYYCWHASNTGKVFQTALERCDLLPRETIIWVKSVFTLGRQDYQWRHEPCFYGWKPGAAHYFIDMRSLTTVYDDLDTITKETAVERLKALSDLTTITYEDKPSASKLHPTMKPLAIFRKLIRNSTRPDENVLDLFGGSGTTLLAAEELGRTCFMMEFDPHYATVIIERWEKETGQTARRI